MSRPQPIEYADASPQVRAVSDDIKRSRNVEDVNNFWKYLAHHPATLGICHRFAIMRGYPERSDLKMNLKSMKIDALIGLKSRIDAVLASNVSDERRALESELAKLTRFESGGTRSKSVGRGVRGKVAPKYRNPENPRKPGPVAG